MSNPKVDVLAALDRAIAKNLERGAAKGSPSDGELRQVKKVVAELIADNKLLAEALRAVITIDMRGHQLQDRLQFSDLGRDVLSKIDAARDALARAGGGK